VLLDELAHQAYQPLNHLLPLPFANARSSWYLVGIALLFHDLFSATQRRYQEKESISLMDLAVAGLWMLGIAARLLHLNNEAPHVVAEHENKASTDR